MKIIVIIMLILMKSSVVFSQSARGMIELSANGSIYQKTSFDDKENGYTINIEQSSPQIGLSYYIHRLVSLDGSVAFYHLEVKNMDAREKGTSTQLSLGGTFHVEKENLWPFLYLRAVWQSGDMHLYEGNRSPYYFGGGVGIKYWPLKGGALVLSAGYDKDIKTRLRIKEIGINVGVLMRLR